ncbi:MAG: diaminopimelate epimerase [Planctomycetota bacterium]
MERKISFAKMHGTGNDFIVVTLAELGGVDAAAFARQACDRHFGAGSDGLLVVAPSTAADTRMRMYNPDGSEAMCGNGIRCFGRFVYERGIVPRSPMRVETIAGVKVLELTVERGAVTALRVDMGAPIFERARIPVAETAGPVPVLDQPITADDRDFRVACVSMGNPHCVIFTDRIDREEVFRYGRIIERHPFFPKRVNVEFVKVHGRDHLELNVFERGAGFTLSCGTGTCASAVAAHERGFTDGAVRVTTPGGELRVEYRRGGNVYMSGPAAWVYTGTYLWNGD